MLNNIPRVGLDLQLSLLKTSTLEALSSECLPHVVDQKLMSFMQFADTIFQNMAVKPHSFMAVSKTGRPAASYDALFLAHLARCFYTIDTVKNLVGFLRVNGALRTYCGFEGAVPSEPTFSRFLKTMSEGLDTDGIVGGLAQSMYRDTIVGNILRDSTTLEACDKAVKRQKVAKEQKEKRKRGRKKKGSQEELEYKKRLLEEGSEHVITKQLGQTPEQSIASLDTNCAFGAKTNAQGVPEYAKGYKAHIDVTDNGIPTAFVITGANVHDSQVAIPLEQLTARRVTSLYSLSDSGYYSKDIDAFIESSGKVALTDPARRRNAIPFSPSERLHFKKRTTVERTNSQMKLYYLPRLFTHGYKKFKFVVGLALCLVSVIQFSKIVAARA